MGDRITCDSLFNTNTTLIYPDASRLGKYTPTKIPPYFIFDAPGNHPLSLGNYYIFSNAQADWAKWRTDGALDQVAGLQGQIWGIGYNSTIGSSDTVTAAPQTYSGALPPHSDVSHNGNIGLIYNEDHHDPSDPNYTGSRFVYSTFGLEALGWEAYKTTSPYSAPSITPPPPADEPYYDVYNLRPNILHNIVSYLRTAEVKGNIQGITTITDSKGNTTTSQTPLTGATVYLRPSGGVIPGMPANHQFYDAVTSGGNYDIQGVEPGNYIVSASANGYQSGTADNQFMVEGDTTSGENLVLNGLPSSTISGTVTDGSTKLPVVGATVTFNADGSSVLSAVTTDKNGMYSVTVQGGSPGIPFTGKATLPKYSSTPIKLSIVSGTAYKGEDFVLTPAPGTVTGTVTDFNGTGLGGVTVTFYPGTATSGAPVQVVTTNPNGTYTTNSGSAQVLPAGSYTVVASLTGYGASPASRPVTVPPAGTVTGIDFSMTALPPGQIPGTVYGYVINLANNLPITNGSVTLSDPVTNSVVATFALGPEVTSTQEGYPAGADGSPENFSGNVLAGTYNVTMTAPGFSPTTSTVVVVSTQSVRIIKLNIPILMPRGLVMFSTPYDYSGLQLTNGAANGWDELLGNYPGARSHVAYWDPLSSVYTLDPGNGAQIGIGYWVRLPTGSDTKINIQGTSPALSTVSVALHVGWNMIGAPSLGNIDISRILFVNPTASGQTLTFDQATGGQYNIVSPILYRYDQASNQYLQVVEGTAVSSGDTRDTFLRPWSGYWIRAYQDTTIILPTQ